MWLNGLAKDLACFRFVKAMTKSVQNKLGDQKNMTLAQRRRRYLGGFQTFFFEGQRLSVVVIFEKTKSQ